MARPEQQIENELVRVLRAYGILVTKIPNELSYNRKKVGVAPGAPDLVVILPKGKTLWLEVKAKYRKPSAKQVEFHNELKKLGHEIRVVYSVEDINDIIKKYGQKFPSSGTPS